jgi:hypothetical protein
MRGVEKSIDFKLILWGFERPSPYIDVSHLDNSIVDERNNRRAWF